MPQTRRPPRARAQPRRRPPADDPPPRRRSRSDLGARILVGLPAAFLAVVFIDLGGLPWALLLIALGCVCLHELYRMLERWKPVPLVGFAAVAGLVLAARFGTEREVLEVVVGTVPVVFLAILLRPLSGGATVAIAGTLLGVSWIGVAFAHAELLRRLPHGGPVTIDILLGTFLGDTAAYLGGRMFGHRQLAPEISPGKTVEGLLCGMFVAILAVFLAGLFQTTWTLHGQQLMTETHALILGVAVAVLAPFGDLFESLIKRDAGTKDAGTLFGAHGGALDRLDAAIFTIVGGYYVWLAIVH